MSILHSEVNNGSESGSSPAGAASGGLRSRRMAAVARHIPPHAHSNRHRERERSVPLRGRLNKDAATCYIARFLVLAAENAERPIIAYVASSGGFASEALTVISTMSGIRCPIVTFCPGAVTGPAIAIAAGGLNGFRIAAPSAVFSFSGFELNSAMRDSEGNDPVLGLFAEALGKSTGVAPAQIIEWVRSGTQLTAAQACEHGLIDEVAEEPVFPESGQ